jgi:hypothetical protein
MCCWLAGFVLLAPLAFAFRRELAFAFQASFQAMDDFATPTTDLNLTLVLMPMLIFISVTLLIILLALVGCCGKINKVEVLSRHRATAAEVLKAV